MIISTLKISYLCSQVISRLMSIELTVEESSLWRKNKRCVDKFENIETVTFNKKPAIDKFYHRHNKETRLRTKSAQREA